MRYDVRQISEMLAARVEDVCSWLLPGGRKNGSEYRAGSVAGGAGDSLGVNLHGKPGIWKDFAGADKGGDLIDLIMAAHSCDKASAVKAAKDWLGVKDDAPDFLAVKKAYKLPAKPAGLTKPKTAVQEYLQKRGISQKTIDAYRIGEVQNQKHGATIVFPYFHGDALKFIKYRPVADKKAMFTSSESEPILFGWQAQDANSRHIIITEGECFPGDARILTPSGWVRLDGYSGGDVAEYVPGSGEIRFVAPTAYVKKIFKGDLLKYSARGYTSVTTPGHNLVSLDHKKRLYKHTAEDGPNSVADLIPRCGFSLGTGIRLTDDQVRFAIAVSADATIDNRKNSGNRKGVGNRYARFGLLKERKIVRLTEMLRRIGVAFSCGPMSDGSTSICCTLPDYIPGRMFPWSWVYEATAEQRELILEELVFWDGNSVPNRAQHEYSSKYIENAEFVQAIAHTSGRCSSIIPRENAYGKWFKTSILHKKCTTSWQSLKGKAESVPHDGPVYCVQVPSGMLVVNQNRHITITGNCDALAFYEQGYPALSIPRGAGTGAQQDEWIANEWERLQAYDAIYLAYDNDEAGQKAQEQVVQRLGRHRCYTLDFSPHKDANELHLAGGRIADVITGAKSCDPPELRSATEFVEDVIAIFEGRDESQGLALPWIKTRPNIRLRYGEISLWAGFNGSGKSQVLGHITVDSIRKGEKWCAASMELKPPRLLARMYRQASGTNQPTPERCRTSISSLFDRKLYLFDVQGTAKADKIFECFEYAMRRYGCRHFLVDSLAKCGFGEDDYNGQKAFIDKLMEFAMHNGVHVHLVAHSRKRSAEQDMPDKMDVKGTGAITDMVDNVFLVWRNKPKEEAVQKSAMGDPGQKLRGAPDCVINCCKQRHGEWEGKVGLFFDRRSLQYVENEGDSPAEYDANVGGGND